MITKTYDIILSETLFLEFIDWLPDCKENEQFYLTLFCRKKYCVDSPWMKSDKSQLGRKTSKKESIFNKVQQMECKVGSYQISGHTVPPEGLAVYISYNPRDLWKATARSISALAKVLECEGKGSNPHQEVLSEIQRTAGTRKYIMFDIDGKDEAVLKECLKICNGLCDVTETRGGYHLFVHKDRVEEIDDKKWYPQLAARSDISNDSLTVPWGVSQGGFVPRPIFRIGDSIN